MSFSIVTTKDAMFEFFIYTYLIIATLYLFTRCIMLTRIAMPKLFLVVALLLGALILLPFAPFYYALKAWRHQPKLLIITALIAYLFCVTVLFLNY